MAWNVWNEPNYIFFSGNKVISSIIVFLSPYFMPLLFLLAGISTKFALQKRTIKKYISERVRKLLIPFVFGTLLLLFVGFGWAKPVPINPNNFEKIRKGVFTVSIAGVTMNLLLAIVNFIHRTRQFRLEVFRGVTEVKCLITNQTNKQTKPCFFFP